MAIAPAPVPPSGPTLPIHLRSLRLLVLVLLAFVVLVPYAWVVATSFKEQQDIFRTGWSTFVPLPPTLRGYLAVFTTAPFARWVANSVVVAGLTTVGQLTIALLAAYSFARYQFRGREVLFFVVLASLMIPPQTIMVPSFVLMVQLDWLNSFQGLIVPHLASGFAIFYLRQFFRSVPRELDDAAAIDGCTSLQRLWLIYVPLAAPVLAALVAILFVRNWNDYYWPFLIISDEALRTVPLAIVQFRDAEGMIDYGPTAAAVVLVTLPTVLIFLAAQRYFIEGTTAGSLKG